MTPLRQEERGVEGRRRLTGARRTLSPPLVVVGPDTGDPGPTSVTDVSRPVLVAGSPSLRGSRGPREGLRVPKTGRWKFVKFGSTPRHDNLRDRRMDRTSENE